MNGPSPGFGALGKNFIIVGNAQHRIFGLRFGYLIRATTSFFCALTPVPRVIKEGPRFHFLACYKVGTPAATSQVDGNKMMMRFRPHHIVATGAVRHPRSRAATCFCHQHAHRDAFRRVTPIRGRLNLPTSPALTGSPPILNSIGLVAVADFAASPEGSLRPPR